MGGQAAGQSLGEAGLTAQGDLAFRTGQKHLVPERLLVVGGRLGRKVDGAAGEMRVFAEHDTEEADGRGLGDGSGTHRAAGGLGAAGDHVQAKFGD